MFAEIRRSKLLPKAVAALTKARSPRDDLPILGITLVATVGVALIVSGVRSLAEPQGDARISLCNYSRIDEGVLHAKMDIQATNMEASEITLFVNGEVYFARTFDSRIGHYAETVQWISVHDRPIFAWVVVKTKDAKRVTSTMAVSDQASCSTLAWRDNSLSAKHEEVK